LDRSGQSILHAIDASARLLRELRNWNPIPAKPSSIIAQVAGSGTAPVAAASVAKIRNPFGPWPTFENTKVRVYEAPTDVLTVCARLS
jgi:hypothetical protein